MLHHMGKTGERLWVVPAAHAYVQSSCCAFGVWVRYEHRLQAVLKLNIRERSIISRRRQHRAHVRNGATVMNAAVQGSSNETDENHGCNNTRADDTNVGACAPARRGFVL